MKNAMTVVDLFCGGGGLSEGFEQAGFDIIFGLDNDTSAVATFIANHAHAAAEKVDLRHYDVRNLPDTDVLIGGPPCTQFSSSKSNKTRNVLDGLELVQAFLRAVHFKKPKYWVMENVATIQKYLPKEIPLSWIGVEEKGNLTVPNRVELVAADFGVPQKRVRYLIGNFPTPSATHSSINDIDLLNESSKLPWRTLGDALYNFPSPLKSMPEMVRDPNYEVSINGELLTDHFYDTRLDRDEIRELRQTKEQHPFMGFMPFTEDTSKPARTVVATQLGRETLVLQDSPDTFRRLTVRECALLQTFPITFQFLGKSYSSKYKLVGNAVPPRLAFHIAQGIRTAEGLKRRIKPIIDEHVTNPSPEPTTPFRKLSKTKKYFELRKFSESIPGKEQRGCRCEFENFSFTNQNKGLENFHRQIWNVTIYVGEGRGCKSYKLDKAQLKDIFHKSDLGKETRNKILEIEKTINKWVKKQHVTSGKELQRLWGSGTQNDSVYEVVDGLCAIIDKGFPKSKYHNLKVKTTSMDWFPTTGIRLRILLGALGGSILAEHLNEPTGA